MITLLQRELMVLWPWINLFQFWNDLPSQARQELLKLDKQTLIEQARKNFYCSRCNGLLLENFKSLQQEVSDIDCLSSTGESRIRQQIESQDPSVHPWGGLATTKDGVLTLIDSFIKAKSLRVLQNVSLKHLCSNLLSDVFCVCIGEYD
jgi:hypothetical protein